MGYILSYDVKFQSFLSLSIIESGSVYFVIVFVYLFVSADVLIQNNITKIQAILKTKKYLTKIIFFVCVCFHLFKMYWNSSNLQFK